MKRPKPVPQPPSGRKAYLHVLPTQATNQAQDCASCRKQQTCWAPDIKEEHIVTNLLVCRIKRGIEVSRATKLFLEMIRPKTKMLARRAIRGTTIDLETAIADLESQTIVYLQDVYVMGDAAFPLHWLFGQPKGWMWNYSKNYARQTRKYEDTHFLSDGRSDDEDVSEELVELEEEETETNLTRKARAIIEDGITLTAQEYRVMKFCLQNASDAKRPLNGLHIFLARTTGLPRARITKIWADASAKIREEVLSSR